MNQINHRNREVLRDARETVLCVRGEVADFSHELALDNRRALAVLEEQISVLGARCPRELLVSKNNVLAVSRSTDIAFSNTLARLEALCGELA